MEREDSPMHLKWSRVAYAAGVMALGVVNNEQPLVWAGFIYGSIEAIQASRHAMTQKVFSTLRSAIKEDASRFSEGLSLEPDGEYLADEAEQFLRDFHEPEGPG